MKIKFMCFLFGEEYYYTVKIKEHWYSKWKYIYNGQYPRLFRLDQLVGMHLISIEELDKYFKADNTNSEVIIKR